MNIKFDYFKCIGMHEKVHSRTGFSQKKCFLGWGSNPQKYYFGGGYKFKMHFSYNETNFKKHFRKFDKIATFFKSGKEWTKS